MPVRTEARSKRGPAALWLGYAAVLVVAPWIFSSSLALTLLTQMGIAIVACLAFNMLLGQGGMLSFGHAVYSGLGGYVAMHALNRISAGSSDLPVSLVPLVGGAAGLFFAALFGSLATRKSGTVFAMITLGLGELVWASSLMFPSFFGGEGGISGNRVAGPVRWGIGFGPPTELYYLTAAYTFVCTALMYAFTRTPLGRLLNAVRDNSERVAFIGYDARLVRYLAFVTSGLFMGIAGGLAALNFEIVTSEVLSAQRSGAYLLFTFVGGTLVFFGPIIGAVLMVLALVLLSEVTQAWLLYLGLAFVVMVMVAPGGVASLVVTALRIARDGRYKGRVATGLAVGASAFVALAGAAALIEMVYHLQLDATLGRPMRFLGLTLDTNAIGTWLGAALVLFTGLGLFTLSRRQFLQSAPPRQPS